MKQTAQGLAALGRGPDTELVHMTKGEVHGLQKLALAHGGSLTINPQTGLPEAGFLSSILPMIAGAALTATGIGAPLAALMVGGGYTMATGSLQKGLMAGLGAYGGAGLVGGLAEAGASSLAGAAPEAAAGLGATTTSGTAAFNAAAAPGGIASQAATQALGGGMFPGAVAGAPAGFGEAATTGINSAFAPNAAAQLPVITPVAPAFAPAAPAPVSWENVSTGAKDIASSGDKAMQFASQNKGSLLGIGASALGSMEPAKLNAPTTDVGMIRPYTMSRTQNEQPDVLGSLYRPGQSTRERQYFTDQYTAGTPYKAPGPEYLADGGIARVAPMNAKMASFSAASDKLSTQQGLRDTIAAAKTGDRAALSALQGAGYDLNNLNTFAGGGPVEQMSNANAIGANTGYPQADIHTGAYASPTQTPISQNMITGSQDAATDPYTGEPQFAAGGGISSLGGYSDGGQLLRGPGDGVSDNIPAMIGDKQHARLADGEFVVPARIVSELGNGSTEAGSRQLYAMMDRVQNARKKSIGKDKVATNTRAAKLLPA